MMRAYRFLGLLVVLSIMAGGSEAAEYKYRIRKRVCQMYDNCPTEDSALKPSGYTARINQDPITGANQSLVSFTISGAQAGDLFNWTLDDESGATAPLSGNGTMSGMSGTISGLNVSGLADGTLTLRVEVSRGGVWGNPVTDTSAKNTSGAGFATFSDGFDDETATAAGQPLTSNTITVSGFAGSLPVSVSGDPSAQVSINGGACTASGSITSGQTLSLCANSPAMDTFKTISVAVGSSTAGWKIATGTAGGVGDAYAWGWNNYGQLGNPAADIEQTSPIITAINGDGSRYITISGGGSGASGSDHACGIDTTGKAWCWGVNGFGMLGDGTTTSSPSPVAVQPNADSSHYSQIAAGAMHTCALDTAGKAWCWGRNGFGELGTGNFSVSYIPTAVLNNASSTTYTQIVAGDNHTCALDTAGDIWCWGSNSWGQLGSVGGDGNLNKNTPAKVAANADGTHYEKVSARGGWHTCALDTAGHAWCWGMNISGELGTGDDVSSDTPRPVVANADSSAYVGISAGGAGGNYEGTCALDGAGKAWCWGVGTYGALGNHEIILGSGSAANRNTPIAVDMNGLVFTSLLAGGAHNCALDTSGNAWCWGYNGEGELGAGNTANQNIPTAVVGGHTFSQIFPGRYTTYAVENGTSPVDTSAPTISTLFPQPGSTDIAEDANLVITFGEDVVAGTGDIVIRKLSDGTAFETIPVTDAKVAIAGKVATINPAGFFASNTAYYVEIAPGAFEDAAGNAFAGIAGSSTWTFTSEVTDFAPPLISTLSPANGATDAATNANLVITFDEPVVKGSGNIVIRKLADASAFETIPVSDTRVSISGNAATINPAGGFASGTPYYVEMAAGTFKDASANAFAGITGISTWLFKTVPGSSPGCPTDDYTACVIDADGAGPIPAITTKCNNNLDGGGWSLIGYIDVTNKDTWNASTTLDPSESASKRVSDAFYTAINATTTDYMFTHCGQKYKVTKASAQPANCMNMATLPSTPNFVDPSRDYSNYTFAWTDPGCNMTGADYTEIEIGTSSLWFNGTFFDAFQWNSNHYIQKWNGTSWQLLSSSGYDAVPGVRMLLYVRGNTAPEALELSPADGAGGVAADENLVITFSKTVVKGTGNIVIRRSAGGTAVETIPVTDAKVSVSGPVATINPAATLAPGTGYYVEVDAGAFKDSASHSFAGISGSGAWNFTTVAGGGSLACAIDWEGTVKPELDRVIALGTSGPPTVTLTSMGATLSDTSKFIGITEGNDGKLYGIPYWSPDILVIDTVAGSAMRSTMGGTFPANKKSSGGVLGDDNRIYGAPNDGGGSVVIDTATGTASYETFGGVTTGVFGGGVLGPDCKLYMTPVRGPDSILVIDPATATAELKDYGLAYPGNTTDWTGAVVGPDNKIYMIPASATNVIVIDPATDTAIQTDFGLDLSGSEKWHGGVLASDGKIYGIPYAAGDVLVIDPASGTATRTDFGFGFLAGYEGGVLAPDGKIYAIPYTAGSILVIDPLAGTASTIESLGGGWKWFGGVLGPDGKVYGVPYDATTILVIDPHANDMWQGGLEKNSMYFNKF